MGEATEEQRGRDLNKKITNQMHLGMETLATTLTEDSSN